MAGVGARADRLGLAGLGASTGFPATPWPGDRLRQPRPVRRLRSRHRPGEPAEGDRRRPRLGAAGALGDRHLPGAERLQHRGARVRDPAGLQRGRPGGRVRQRPQPAVRPRRVPVPAPPAAARAGVGPGGRRDPPGRRARRWPRARGGHRAAAVRARASSAPWTTSTGCCRRSGCRTEGRDRHLAPVARADRAVALADFAGRIAHVHIADCDGENHGDLPPGRGTTPFPAYLEALREAGFEGTAAVELEFPVDGAPLRDWVTEAYGTSSRLLADAGVRGTTRSASGSSAPAGWAGCTRTRCTRSATWPRSSGRCGWCRSRARPGAHRRDGPRSGLRAHTTWEEVVADPRGRGLAYLGPNELHAEPCDRGPRVGKPVLCEKPLGGTWPTAGELAAARSADVTTPAASTTASCLRCGWPASWWSERAGRRGRFRASYLEDWASSPRCWASGASPCDGPLEARSATTRTSSICCATWAASRAASTPSRPSTPIRPDVEDAYSRPSTSRRRHRLARGLAGGDRLEGPPAHRVQRPEGSLWWDMEDLTGCTCSPRDEAERTGGFRDILVTQPDHPFLDLWWPPGHTIGWEHSFIHQWRTFLTAIIAGGRRRRSR